MVYKLEKAMCKAFASMLMITVVNYNVTLQSILRDVQKNAESKNLKTTMSQLCNGICLTARLFATKVKQKTA